jgi:multisubunit Na+/H+ antiporter MnhE subunit
MELPIGLDFSFGSLMAGFVFGVFGFYLLKEGRRQGHFWWLGLGLFLMIYPYFITNTWLLWLIGIAGLWLAYMKR